MIKSANGDCYADDLETLKESVFKEDFKFHTLERHLGVLVDVIHQALPRELQVFEPSVMQ